MLLNEGAAEGGVIAAVVDMVTEECSHFSPCRKPRATAKVTMQIKGSVDDELVEINTFNWNRSNFPGIESFGNHTEGTNSQVGVQSGAFLVLS
jgi:hypothetical protein